MRDPLVTGVWQPYSPLATNKGYSGPLQQLYESSFDPSSGYTRNAEYKALDWTSAVTLGNYFTSLGMSVKLKNENGVSTLTLTDATGNYVIDKWELSVDKEQPDMFENPLFLNFIGQADYPTRAISIMRNVLKNNSDFDPTNDIGWYNLVRVWVGVVLHSDPVTGVVTAWGVPANLNKQAQQFILSLGPSFVGTYPGNDGTTSQTKEWTSANMVKLKQYIDSYQLGVTNFMRGKYRLRHTSNIPAQWNVSVADYNVEEIYTITQLIAECTSGSFIYPLPNYLSYKILNFIPDPVSAWTPYYTWGALKGKSDAQTAVNNRIELQTEYLIDNINTNLYNHI
jgi:hypothetical protein